MRWMKLEPIIQSKVSQKEKHQYSIRSDQIRSVTQSCPTKDCSILYQCFSFWLTSLCIIGSSFIHLIRTDSNVFFLMAEYYSILYMYHNFLIHSSADGHLGCFHVLVIINSAVMNIGVHVSLSILVQVYS